MRDDGVTPVLGTLLMLALMATLVPGVIMMRSAMSQEMEAYRDAAERSAWCARNPSIGPPHCAARGPMPGYACSEVETEVWVCRPQRLPPARLDPDLVDEAPQEPSSARPADPPALPVLDEG